MFATVHQPVFQHSCGWDQLPKHTFVYSCRCSYGTRGRPEADTAAYVRRSEYLQELSTTLLPCCLTRRPLRARGAERQHKTDNRPDNKVKKTKPVGRPRVRGGAMCALRAGGAAILGRA